MATWLRNPPLLFGAPRKAICLWRPTSFSPQVKRSSVRSWMRDQFFWLCDEPQSPGNNESIYLRTLRALLSLECERLDGLDDR